MPRLTLVCYTYRKRSPVTVIAVQDVLVGHTCASHLLDVKAAQPVQNGHIQDWEAMTMLWDHTFRDLLSIEPADHKILLTEAPMVPLSSRTRTMEIMFEQYGFSAAFLQIQAALTLYAQGTQAQQECPAQHIIC